MHGKEVSCLHFCFEYKRAIRNKFGAAAVFTESSDSTVFCLLILTLLFRYRLTGRLILTGGGLNLEPEKGRSVKDAAGGTLRHYHSGSAVSSSGVKL